MRLDELERFANAFDARRADTLGSRHFGRLVRHRCRHMFSRLETNSELGPGR